MALIVWTCGEIDLLAAARRSIIADDERPQPVDLHHRSVALRQGFDKALRVRVVHVDRAVAEVADQQIARNRTERRRGDGHAPRR